MANNVVKLSLAQGALASRCRLEDRRGLQSRRVPLDMRQLRYFIAVVDAGSFSRAAERVHIAQPALSQHVLSMESMLGVTLLQRSARGVVPTEAGLRLLDRARELELQFSTLSGHVRGDMAPAGQVRVGLPASLSDLISLRLIGECSDRYPDIRLRISEAPVSTIGGWLRDRMVDLSLLYGDWEDKRVVLHGLVADEIVLFGRGQDEAVACDDDLEFGEALKLPLILPGSGHGLREIVEASTKLVGGKVCPSIELDSYNQIKKAVAAGYGYGMLPAAVVQEDCEAGLFRCRRVRAPTPIRTISLGYRSDLSLSPASRAVAQLIIDVIEGIVERKEWTAVLENERLNLRANLTPDRG